MHIAILTFEGFNELDTLIALGVLNRVKQPGWRVSIASPSARVRSMNGVVLEAQASLQEASVADAVIVGSGMRTREVVADAALMAQLQLDPARQLLGAQCSGTLVLAKLGLLDRVPACTDLTTQPWVEEACIAVLNQPFFARGNVATAGGCLASLYLATWVMARLVGVEAAESAMHYVARWARRKTTWRAQCATSRPIWRRRSRPRERARLHHALIKCHLRSKDLSVMATGCLHP